MRNGKVWHTYGRMEKNAKSPVILGLKTFLPKSQFSFQKSKIEKYFEIYMIQP